MIDSSILEAFDPISLQEMGQVKLMNRIDSKYVTTVDKICEMLRAASSQFYIQEIDARRNMPYYTRYYDTPEADMYYQHHRGKKNRQKIRIRQYEETSTAPFLEIKTKNNKGHTRKKRVVMTDKSCLQLYHNFLDENASYASDSLVPQIENHFYRITLVNKAKTERITIDTALEFHNLTTGQRVSLPNIGIIERKRAGNADKSCLDSILRELRIHPSGFSKYCIGMALTDTTLKQNRFKARIRKIDKLSKLI